MGGYDFWLFLGRIYQPSGTRNWASITSEAAKTTFNWHNKLSLLLSDCKKRREKPIAFARSRLRLPSWLCRFLTRQRRLPADLAEPPTETFFFFSFFIFSSLHASQRCVKTLSAPSPLSKGEGSGIDIGVAWSTSIWSAMLTPMAAIPFLDHLDH